MRVLVTGGTGFIGSHTVRALLAAGHGVRVLARDPAKAERVFRGAAAPEVAAGDVVDAGAVARALSGCDAVVHAAAVVAMEAARAREVEATNVRGLESVVGAAAERGLGPLVVVSSASALQRPGVSSVAADGPLGEAGSAYTRSKVEGDRWLRRLQSKGVPVSTTYPTAVIGPDDPGLSEGNHTVRVFVRDLVIDTTSGFQIVDVRDLARLHVALLEGAREPGRWAAAGPFVPWSELADLLDGLTGARVRRLAVPGGVLRAAGRVCDVIKRMVPFDFPLTREGMEYATRWVPVDAGPTTEALGVHFRTAEESFRDTIRWLVAAGHLPARRAGRLAPEPASGVG